MEAVTAWPEPCAGCGGRAAAGALWSASSLDGMSLHQEQTADLKIVTAEGDKVSLSAEYRAEAAWMNTEYVTVDGGGRRQTAGEWRALDFNRQVSLSVEGDLNEKEMSDIEALLNDLGKMFRGFLTGSGDRRPPEAERIDAGASLARVDATLEYRAQFEAVNAKVLESAAEDRGSAPVAPVAALPPSAPKPAAGLPPPVIAAPPESDRSEADRTVDRMVHRAGRCELRPHRLRRLLDQFLRRLMQDLHAEGAIDTKGIRRGEKVVERLLNRLDPADAGVRAASSRVALRQVSVEAFFELHIENRPSPAIEQTA